MTTFLRCIDAEERGIRMPSKLKSVAVADAPDVASGPSSGADISDDAMHPHVGPDVDTSGHRRATGRDGGDTSAIQKGSEGLPEHLRMTPEQAAKLNGATW